MGVSNADIHKDKHSLSLSEESNPLLSTKVIIAKLDLNEVKKLYQEHVEVNKQKQQAIEKLNKFLEENREKQLNSEDLLTLQRVKERKDILQSEFEDLAEKLKVRKDQISIIENVQYNFFKSIQEKLVPFSRELYPVTLVR